METLLSYGIEVNAVLARGGMAALARVLAERLPEAHLQLVRSLEIWASVGDYFFCHAGARPGVPLARQSESDLLWIRHPFLASDFAFEKVVVHGHTPAEAVEFRPNRINVDTGAYMTGRLSCLVLEGEGRRHIDSVGPRR
jgi:serine/threonine protein phosphatase 1